MQGLRKDEEGKIDDGYWWKKSAKGVFTLKSAYELLRLEVLPETANLLLLEKLILTTDICNDLIVVADRLLSRCMLQSNLWPSTKLLPLQIGRVSDVMGCCSWSINLLWEGTIKDTPRCELCGDAHESTLHATRDCKLPCEVWKVLQPNDAPASFWVEMDPYKWIQLNIQRNRAMYCTYGL